MIEREMPGEWPATWCSLLLAGWTDIQPSVEMHHNFRDIASGSVPQIDDHLWLLRSVSLYREGNADSAATIRRNASRHLRRTPELLPVYAAALAGAGRLDSARAVVATYMSTGPQSRQTVLISRELQSIAAGAGY
jgi:hypothetical protein